MWSAQGHAKLVVACCRCFAKREKNRSPQLAQPSPSQLVSFTTARPARPFANKSHIVSSTTARPARPFEARLIHYSSPSPALRSSCYPPQLVQLGPSQLVSFTTARPARPFAARPIHQYLTQLWQVKGQIFANFMIFQLHESMASQLSIVAA